MKETLRFVPNPKCREGIEKLIKKRYRYQCFGCKGVFKKKRQEFFYDGHTRRLIDMCVCGCGLFMELKDIVPSEVVVEPIDNKLIFKEHHAKYCRCHKGQLWTGRAETECWALCNFISEKNGKRTLRCIRSGLTIIILKSSEEELKSPDELGLTYLRIPG